MERRRGDAVRVAIAIIDPRRDAPTFGTRACTEIRTIFNPKCHLTVRYDFIEGFSAPRIGWGPNEESRCSAGVGTRNPGIHSVSLDRDHEGVPSALPRLLRIFSGASRSSYHATPAFRLPGK